jgi:hypothetical protein
MIQPSGNYTVTLEKKRNLDGDAISMAPGSLLQVRISQDVRYAGATHAGLNGFKPAYTGTRHWRGSCASN